MLTKKLFVKAINNYNDFDKAIDRISKAIAGEGHYFCDIFQTDWCDAVYGIFDSFIHSHFNDCGCDLIEWWLWEDVDKIITLQDGTEVNVESLDALWEYIVSYKEDYFLNE